MSHHEERAFMNEEMARDIDDPLQYAEREIERLEAELKQAREIIICTPVLKIDVKVARMRGEDEAIEYTKKLVEWDTRARTFLKEHEDG